MPSKTEWGCTTGSRRTACTRCRATSTARSSWRSAASFTDSSPHSKQRRPSKSPAPLRPAMAETLAMVVPGKYEREVVDLVAEVERQRGQAKAVARRTQGDRGRIAIERLDQHHAVERAQRRGGGG